MKYRLAEEIDIEPVISMIESAMEEMERQGISQWDSSYLLREVFLAEIRKKNLYIGMSGNDIAVIYTVNKESDSEYGNGTWEYTQGDYRIIHRLCVNPKYQNKGLAGKILAHIENELRENGIDSIRLDVFCSNPYALSLYRKTDTKRLALHIGEAGSFS